LELFTSHKLKLFTSQKLNRAPPRKYREVSAKPSRLPGIVKLTRRVAGHPIDTSQSRENKHLTGITVGIGATNYNNPRCISPRHRHAAIQICLGNEMRLAPRRLQTLI
jgi:hypothetical protein